MSRHSVQGNLHPAVSSWMLVVSVLGLCCFSNIDSADAADSACWNPDGTLVKGLNTFDKAVCAIGGGAALDNALIIEATGVRAVYGEGYSPQDTPQPVAHFQLKTSVQRQNLRVDWRTSIFPGTPMEKSLSYSEILRGDLGYLIGVDNWLVTPTTNIPSGRVASIRKQQMLTYPHLYLAQAKGNPSLISTAPLGQATEAGTSYEVLTLNDGRLPPVHLYVDPVSGHIAKLETQENDHVFRDVSLAVTYRDWTVVTPESGQLSFPMNVALMGRGQLWYEEHRTKISQSPSFTHELDFPPGAAPVFNAQQFSWGQHSSQFVQMWCTFGVAKNEQQLNVDPQELAPGVYFIKGAMYNSLVVDQGESVVVIEAPLYPERSAAILAWIAATLKKPVSQLVVTHHHLDHIGGVRAYVAAGVPIMTGRATIDLLGAAASAPSTVNPDAQQMARAAPKFIAIDKDALGVIEKGSSAVKSSMHVPTGPLDVGRHNVVYAVPLATSHVEGAVFVKVATRPDGPTVLFQSDMFNPDDRTGRALNPMWAVDLAHDLNKLGLNQPNTILTAGHAGYSPLSQLYSFVETQVSTQIKAYVFYQRNKTVITILFALCVLTAAAAVGRFFRSGRGHHRGLRA